MLAFLSKIFDLVKPYKLRLALGVVCGILAGLAEPLMVGVIAFVFMMVFPSAKSDALELWLQKMPPYIQQWISDAQSSMATGSTTHIWAVIGIIGLRSEEHTSELQSL